jgi:dTDP-4-dehydrorhamnose reductase
VARLLVTGAGGMLGRDVARAAEQAGHELHLRDRAALDITDAAAVEEAIASLRPDAVVNCAAWTDVDGAESHEEQALAVNRDGAGILGQTAASAGAKLVHVSTDYVFDGQAPLDTDRLVRPYVESDQTGPRTVYGQSKLEGELRVLSASPRHAVVRSAWLFGVDGHNFVATMLRLAGEASPEGPRTLKVVDDQTGSPTWTGHLAPALIDLVEQDLSGLTHVAGGGAVTWNGFAREIFRQAELECVVEPVTTAEMARPAPRPSFSVLASERDEVPRLPDWRDGLAGYLAARTENMRP